MSDYETVDLSAYPNLFPKSAETREYIRRKPTKAERMARCRNTTLISWSHVRDARGEITDRHEVMPYLCGLRSCEKCRAQKVHKEIGRLRGALAQLPGEAVILSCPAPDAPSFRRFLSRRAPDALVLLTIYKSDTAFFLVLAELSDLFVVLRQIQNKSDTHIMVQRLFNSKHVLQWAQETLDKAFATAEAGAHAFSWARGLLRSLGIVQAVSAYTTLWRRTFTRWESLKQHLTNLHSRSAHISELVYGWRYLVHWPTMESRETPASNQGTSPALSPC